MIFDRQYTSHWSTELFKLRFDPPSSGNICDSTWTISQSWAWPAWDLIVVCFAVQFFVETVSREGREHFERRTNLGVRGACYSSPDVFKHMDSNTLRNTSEDLKCDWKMKLLQHESVAKRDIYLWWKQLPKPRTLGFTTLGLLDAVTAHLGLTKFAPDISLLAFKKVAFGDQQSDNSPMWLMRGRPTNHYLDERRCSQDSKPGQFVFNDLAKSTS